MSLASQWHEHRPTATALAMTTLVQHFVEQASLHPQGVRMTALCRVGPPRKRGLYIEKQDTAARLGPPRNELFHGRMNVQGASHGNIAGRPEIVYGTPVRPAVKSKNRSS